MPYGNILAILAIISLPLSAAALAVRGPGYNDRAEGMMIIFFILSTFSMLGGFIYFVVKYGQAFNQTRFVQWIGRNPNKFGAALVSIMIVFLLISVRISRPQHHPSKGSQVEASKD